jgi:hypothetical protein
MKHKIIIITILLAILFLVCTQRDNEPPSVYIVYPAKDAKVSGVINIQAFASDNREVAYVEFFVNEEKYGVDSIATNSIYKYTWNVSNETAGIKEITARAYDHRGNVGEAPIVRVILEFPAGPTYHEGVIEQDEVWMKSQNPHIVTNNLGIEARLTIEAGVIIRFDYTVLGVQEEGVIVGGGTNNEPVLFTSNEKYPDFYDWVGIELEEGSIDLTNCIIEYAGDIFIADEGSFSLTNSSLLHTGGIELGSSSLILTNCNIDYTEAYDAVIYGEDIEENNTILIDNCTIRNCEANGIILEEIEEMADIQIKNTTITLCEEYPVIIENPEYIRALGPGNNFTNNANNEILISGSEDITTSGSWCNCGVPYLIEADLTITSNGWQEEPPIITIQPDVVLKFDGGGISIEDGTLIADGRNGTIIFTGEDDFGSWEGIVLEEGSLTLQNCIIEFAGGSDAAVFCEFADEFRSILIDNCIIRYCEGSGFYLEDIEENSFVQIKNTIITQCEEYPVVINNANYIKSLGPGNNFSGNGYDEIYIGDFEDEITTTGTWYNCGVPYLIEDDIIITEDWQNTLPIITILPGVILKFEDGGLYVEEGALIADGEAGTIIFSGEEYGHWDGIFFEDDIDDRLTLLNKCIIQAGGDGGGSNIYCDSCSPRITNNEICYSAGWGMILSRRSGLNPDTLLRYNRFHSNDSGNILVDTTGTYNTRISNLKSKASKIPKQRLISKRNLLNNEIQPRIRKQRKELNLNHKKKRKI